MLLLNDTNAGVRAIATAAWYYRPRHEAARYKRSAAITAFSSTSAPCAMSSAVENSFGEWLIPPTLGMKIIPIGAIRAISCAS